METEEEEIYGTEIEPDDRIHRFNTLTDDRKEINCSISSYLKVNLMEVQKAVLTKNWDYLSIISGYPGTGKSTLAQRICKCLDPTFTTKDRICFTGTGEDGLIERTSVAKKGQAFMLDEGFLDLNTRVTRSPEFSKIVSHLQLIRQKGLFIIVCLPNFFELSKGIAVFRASHLFVVFKDEKWSRGSFAAFSKVKKKKLYVDGNRYMDYDCVKPSWKSSFSGKWIADQPLYEKLKAKHLLRQSVDKPDTKLKVSRDSLINFLLHDLKMSPVKVASVSGLTRSSIYNIKKKYQHSNI